MYKNDEVKYNPWNKYFWGAVAAVAMLSVFKACTPDPAFAVEREQIPEVIGQVLLPTVRVDNNCTGTIIASTVGANPALDQTLRVLTAKHCMNSDVKIGEVHNVTYLITSDNQIISELTLPLEVVKIAPGDMVILQNKTRVNVTLPAADVISEDELFNLTFGTKVYCISFGAAQSPVLTEGYLGYQDNLAGFGDIQRASCPTIGGSSGSGLFIMIDGKFKLIGTLTGGWGESFNFYTPAYQVVQFLTSPNSVPCYLCSNDMKEKV